MFYFFISVNFHPLNNEVCISENLVRNPLIDVALLILQASLEADENKDVISKLNSKFSNGFEKVLQNKNEKKQMEERQEVREVACQSLETNHRLSLPNQAAKVRVHEETMVEEHERFEDGGFSHGNPDFRSIIEGLMVLVQALSRAGMDEEALQQLRGSYFDSLEGPSVGKKKKQIRLVNQGLHEDGKVLDAVSVKRTHEELGARDEEREGKETSARLISFLEKALSKGALALNDKNALLQCFHETAHERVQIQEKRNQFAQENGCSCQ